MSSNEGHEGPGEDGLQQLRAALQDDLVVLQAQVGRLEQLLDRRRPRRSAGRAGPRLVLATENKHSG